jgi:hypothetical protein
LVTIGDNWLDECIGEAKQRLQDLEE